MADRPPRPRGRPKKGQEIRWADIDPLLGTTHDSRLARRFGMKGSTICQRRHLLGVPAFQKYGSAVQLVQFRKKLEARLDQLVAERRNLNRREELEEVLSLLDQEIAAVRALREKKLREKDLSPDNGNATFRK